MREDSTGSLIFIDYLDDSVFMSGPHFESSRCKILTQGWPKALLFISEEETDEVYRFSYMGSCTSAGGIVSDEMLSRKQKARFLYVDSSHL